MNTTTVKTLRAVNYCRVSTTKQTGERHSSLETQQSRFREYCVEHDLIPVGEFIDVASGRKSDRKEYQRMVEFVQSGGADVIVTQFLDRLGRKPSEIVPRFYQLKDKSVEVQCTDEDVREELIFLLRAGIAGEESKKNSIRVRAYMAKSVSKGVHAARPPYGLRKRKAIEDDKLVTAWELDPAEAPIVREMYRMATVHNLGYKSISDRLAEMGYLARNGKPFATYTIQQILTNPAMKGTLIWGKRPRKGNPPSELVEVPDFFPAILNQQEWDALQERLEINRESSKGRARSSDYLLSGIAKCGHCGGPLVGKKGGKYRRYYCGRTLKAKALCGVSNGHSATKLEKVILDELGRFTDPAKVREMVNQNQTEKDSKTSREARKKELVSTEKRIAHLEGSLLKDFERLDNGLINDTEFRLINEARRAELSQLQAKQADLSKAIEETSECEALTEKVPHEIRSFFEDFQTLDIRQQKARLQSIVKAIYVWNDNRIEIEFR
ncbi:MAG: recombinase family protein [Dehalococcoidia bacterium]